MMKPIRRSIALAVVLLGGLALQAEAQEWRFDFGVNGGGSWLTSALDEDRLATDSQVEFDAGWMTGAQATLWLGTRFGLRGNFAYADRAVAFDGDETLVGGNDNLIDDVNLWTGTGDLMFRFVEPMDRFMGFRMLPYLTAGFGARWVNPRGDRFAITGEDDDFLEDDQRTGEPFGVGEDTYFLEETLVPAYRAGLGADARLSEHTALRFEVGDLMWEPPFHEIDPATAPVYATTDTDVANLNHELYATLGVHVLFGTGGDRQVTAALSAPRPEDRPTEQRDRTRADMERADMQPVSVCVADPATGPDGLLLVEAHYRPAEGDTVVDDRGRTMDIREYVAHDQDMLEHRDELTRDRDNVRIETGGEPIEYAPSGEARSMPEGLVYLGRVHGLPVYTMKSDLTMLGSRLVETRESPSLDEWMMQDEANARSFRSEVTTLFVPVQRVGCVFRPLEQVGGGS